MGDVITAIYPMLVILIFIMVIVAFSFFIFNKFINLSNKTARKIEIIGYFFLFVILVWELLIKNIIMNSFYNANSLYLNEKLNYIYSTRVNSW